MMKMANPIVLTTFLLTAAAALAAKPSQRMVFEFSKGIDACDADDLSLPMQGQGPVKVIYAWHPSAVPIADGTTARDLLQHPSSNHRGSRSIHLWGPVIPNKKETAKTTFTDFILTNATIENPGG
jgi:hypothetical protein